MRGAVCDLAGNAVFDFAFNAMIDVAFNAERALLVWVPWIQWNP